MVVVLVVVVTDGVGVGEGIFHSLGFCIFLFCLCIVKTIASCALFFFLAVVQ